MCLNKEQLELHEQIGESINKKQNSLTSRNNAHGIVHYIAFASKQYLAGWNLVGRFTGLISITLLVFTYLGVNKISFPIEVLAGFAIAIGFSIFLIGFVFLRSGLYRAESEKFFRENPQNVEMHQDLKEIRRILEKKEV